MITHSNSKPNGNTTITPKCSPTQILQITILCLSAYLYKNSSSTYIALPLDTANTTRAVDQHTETLTIPINIIP